MTVKRAHHYHKPRGKTAAKPPTPKDNQSTVGTPPTHQASHSPVEHSDLRTAPSSTRQTHSELKIDIPADYQAVMRKDYFVDNYVIIAPKRHLRPQDFTGTAKRLVETATSPRLDLQKSIDEVRDRNGNWRTKVVDNKFPALTLDNPMAFGKQEIVIDTPLPNTPLGRVDHDQLTAVLKTYQKRTVALSKIRGIRYVTVFKNDGVRAGASLAHAHSQIFATPLIPTKVARISAAVEAYFQKTTKPPYDTVIAFEKQQNQRVITETDHFIAFCPFAPRWPLDAWIVPKNHAGSITELDETELRDLATVLGKLIGKLTRFAVDYNFYVENGVSPNHRMAIKLQARSLNWWAGFEVASEIAINPIPPEVAADWYRQS